MQVIARKPLRPNDVERVEKDRDSQGVNAFKDREEGRIAQFSSPNVRAEIDAGQPSSVTARSTSPTAASGFCRGRVARPTKRSGWARVASAIASLTSLASRTAGV